MKKRPKTCGPFPGKLNFDPYPDFFGILSDAQWPWGKKGILFWLLECKGIGTLPTKKVKRAESTGQLGPGTPSPGFSRPTDPPTSRPGTGASRSPRTSGGRWPPQGLERAVWICARRGGSRMHPKQWSSPPDLRGWNKLVPTLFFFFRFSLF